MSLNLSDSREITPVLGSRRGEATAWVLAAIVMMAAGFVSTRGVNLGLGGMAVILFFLLAAAMISFGNWVERKTVMKLGEKGIAFKNGLRNVSMDWGSVRGVEVYPSKPGKRVRVIGSDAQFTFHIYGELKWQGEVKDQIGFEHGEEILNTIVRTANLTRVDQQPHDSYYYVRE